MDQLGSLKKVYLATWPDCLRLCIVSSVILCLLGLVLVPYRDDILNNFIGLFIPSDWLASFQITNKALFHQLGGALLFQTVAIACFSTISLCFFSFRDRISLLVETTLSNNHQRGPGLKRELWLEAGLVMIAFNVYSAVYLLAYFIGQPLFGYIDELAFLLLMLFFIVDLLSPSYFRRNQNCLNIARALRRRPMPLLLFGSIFCAPIFMLEIYLGALIYQQDSNTVLSLALVAIIVLNCIVCIFALPMGTWLALKYLGDDTKEYNSNLRYRRHRLFFICQFVAALLLLLFYGSVIGVLSNKVALKSADYDIQWTTMDYQRGTDSDPPSLRFDVQVFNRHQSLGLEVENATLLVNLDGRYLGEAGLNIPYVAPNTTLSVPVNLQLKVDFSELAGIATEEFFSFFSGKSAPWRDNIQARLMVQLPLGLELPIYLTEGYRHQFDEQ